MSHRSVNYVFFGFRNLQGLQEHLQEPIESLQIVSSCLPDEAEKELKSTFGEKLKIVQDAQNLQVRSRMRGFLLTDLRAVEDAFFEWTGRQDFPFVVTVKESHRTKISQQNRLQEFHPNIDLLLRELIV